MENFRNLIRGWLGKVLLVIFLAPLAFGGITHYFGGGNHSTALTINDEKISQQEYDQWLQSQQQRYLQAAGGDSSLLNSAVIEKQVQEAAILRALLLQQAKSLGITLTDEQLGSLIRQLPELQDNGKFSQQKLDQLLAANQMTVPGLLDDFRKQTALNLLTSSTLSTSLLSPADQSRVLGLLAQERSVKIASVPLQQFAANWSPSSAEVQRYYQTNTNQFVQPVSIDVDYVVLSPAQIARQVQVTEQDIQQQYQRYIQTASKDTSRQISHILIATDQRNPQQALALAQDVSRQLKAGGDFAQLAAKYSDDPISKAVKGHIDGFTLGTYGNEFDQAVLALKVGQVSEPVKTQFGYHLIRLDQLNAGSALPLAQVRDQMVAQATKQKADQTFQATVNEATDLATQSDDLKAIASRLQVSLQSANGVTSATRDPILADPAVKTKLFSAEVAGGEWTVSAPITLKSGEVVWVKPRAYHASRQQPLTEATPQIVQQLKRIEQVRLAQAAVQPLVQQLNTQPLENVLATSQLPFRDLGPVPRFSQKVPQKVEQAIYATPQPTAGHAAGTTAVEGDQLYVIAVSAVRADPAAMQLTDAQKQQVMQRFAARGQAELNDYLAYLRSKATIKTPETPAKKSD